MTADSPGVVSLEGEARRLFGVAVEAADPERATRRALEESSWSRSMVDTLDSGGRGRIVAFGKAATGMAAAAIAQLRAVSDGAVERVEGVVVEDLRSAGGRSGGDLAGLERLAAGHPLPDAGSVAAGKAVLECVAGLEERDRVLVLVSGGGSALLVAPRPPVTLQEKQRTTQLLLESGANIDEVNCVRKHLSSIKGGQLAERAAPARLEALLLSDVIGDDPSAIASGPTVPDPTSFADALAILDRTSLLSRIPASVRSLLEQGAASGSHETPKPGDPVFEHTRYRIVGSNAMSVAAIDRALGGRARVVESPTLGDARRAGEQWARRLAELLSRPTPEGPVLTSGPAVLAVIAGGETTVDLGEGLDSAARGGRNQELALSFALAAEELGLVSVPWVFLSAGTDGLDGPTDAAGAIVDRSTIERCRQGGIDPGATLERHDSYAALEVAGDLLYTGPTGTNVADVQILLVGRAP